MSYPVSPVVRPANLAGQANGKLDYALMVQPRFPGRPLAWLHTQTARSWAALAAEIVSRFGEILSITSTPDAYRSYEVQERTFRDRYTTTVLPNRPRKFWQGQWWYQKPNTAVAATPGTSNHGWGLAVDACLWRNDTAVNITANRAMFDWLVANEHLYGFSHETQSEPWHLRLFTGDNTPSAVLEFEAGPAPPPPDPVPSPPPPDPVPPPPAPLPTQRIVTVTVDLPYLQAGVPDQNAVGMLQTKLNVLAGQGLAVDNNFGSKTTQAVKNWQTWFHLTVDGECGAKTWGSVLSVEAQHNFAT